MRWITVVTKMCAIECMTNIHYPLADRSDKVDEFTSGRKLDYGTETNTISPAKEYDDLLQWLN